MSLPFGQTDLFMFINRSAAASSTQSLLSFIMRRSKVSFAKFDWQDPLNFESCLTEEEKMIAESAKEYCQSQLFPRVLKAFREESTIGNPIDDLSFTLFIL